MQALLAYAAPLLHHFEVWFIDHRSLSFFLAWTCSSLSLSPTCSSAMIPGSKGFRSVLTIFYNISRHQCYIRLTHNFMLEFLFITTTHSYMYIDLHQHFLSRIINSLVALSPPSFPWMNSSLFTQESLCHIVDQFSQCFHPRLPRLLFCSSTIHSSMLDSFFPTISLWIPLCKWIYYWMPHFSTNCSLVYIQCIASSSSEPGTTWVLFNRE